MQITFFQLSITFFYVILGYILNDNFIITTEAFIVYLFLMLVLIYILSFVENLQEIFFSLVSALTTTLLNANAFYRTNLCFDKYYFLIAKKIHFTCLLKN